jgi:2-haloacid dehalogenase
VALTNGSAQTTQHLLKQAALEPFVARVVSIDKVRHWKPRVEVYLHAANVAGVPPVGLCLVAAHAGDILGANHAGLLTAWVARKEKKFHTAMEAPDVTGELLTDVVAQIVDLPLDV